MSHYCQLSNIRRVSWAFQFVAKPDKRVGNLGPTLIIVGWTSYGPEPLTCGLALTLGSWCQNCYCEGETHTCGVSVRSAVSRGKVFPLSRKQPAPCGLLHPSLCTFCAIIWNSLSQCLSLSPNFTSSQRASLTTLTNATLLLSSVLFWFIVLSKLHYLRVFIYFPIH